MVEEIQVEPLPALPTPSTSTENPMLINPILLQITPALAQASTMIATTGRIVELEDNPV